MHNRFEMNNTLSQLLREIIKIEDIPDIPISGISTNSSDIKTGELYIAIKGNNYDGHAFIPEAIKNGASAVVTDNNYIKKQPIPIIKVTNTRKVVSRTAAEFYDHPTKKMNVVGITGTNGKTSTASIITSILKSAGKKTAQIGTLGIIADGYSANKGLTTPDSITLHQNLMDLYNDGFTHIVMEASSHALDQYRVNDIDFNYTVFTNLYPEHLDYHGSIENYFEAKIKLFTSYPNSIAAIINIDTEYGKVISDKCSVPVVNTSMVSNTDISFLNYKISLNGIHGTIKAGKISYDIKSSMIGVFNAENILCAAAVSKVMGISKKAIEDGINSCNSIPGRMEIFSLSSGAIAIVDYAHTPDAYNKVLSTIKNLMVDSEANIFIVFGCGGNRDKSKRPQMAAIVEQFATHSFVTPDNPRNENLSEINDEIISGFKKNNFDVFIDREKGLKTALDKAVKNDIVIALGKGRENYQEIDGELISYSDINIIKQYSYEN